MNRQLVIVRQFFDQAKRAPAAQTPFVRMRRLLDLDLCVELALGVVAGDHGTPEAKGRLARKDFAWPELWDAADGAALTTVQKGLPSGKDLRTLHEQRNLAQHRGVIPSVEDLAAWVEPVRALLAFVCQEFYQRDFERLEHWDVLECQPLRQLLTDSASALERGEHEPTMRVLANAYEAIARAVQVSVAGRVSVATTTRNVRITSRELQDVVQTISDVLAQAKRQLIQGMHAIEAEVMAVGLGLPMPITSVSCGIHAAT